MGSGITLAGIDLGKVKKQFSPPPASSVLYLPGYPPGGSTIYDKSLQAEAGTPNNGTITGATWVRLPSGLWVLNFDGDDDIVTVANAASIQNIFDSPGGTIVAWINPASTGENTLGRIWDKAWHVCYLYADSGSGTCKPTFVQNFSVSGAQWATTNYVITYLKPVMVSVSYNNSAVENDPVICIDGNPVAITETSVPVGTRVTDAANPLYIGNSAATTRTFDGYIGLFRALKGVMLSTAQLSNIYQQERHLFGR